MPSPVSSWSVASISASRRMFSVGGPFRRRGSEGLLVSPPEVCACRVHVRVSGLYWKMAMLASGLAISKPMMAPLTTGGERGTGHKGFLGWSEYGGRMDGGSQDWHFLLSPAGGGRRCGLVAASGGFGGAAGEQFLFFGVILRLESGIQAVVVPQCAVDQIHAHDMVNAARPRLLGERAS